MKLAFWKKEKSDLKVDDSTNASTNEGLKKNNYLISHIF